MEGGNSGKVVQDVHVGTGAEVGASMGVRGVAVE